jgi:hypothetical protein
MTFLPGPEPENEQAVFRGGRLQEIRYCSALALTSACGRFCCKSRLHPMDVDRLIGR